MKKKILALLLTGLFTAPFTAIANSDDSQYPAANFQPTVIFADESAASSGNSSQTPYDSDFPASSFQPKVLYSDASAASSSRSSSSAKTSTYDPDYPAANFEPKIIYP